MRATTSTRDGGAYRRDPRPADRSANLVQEGAANDAPEVKRANTRSGFNLNRPQSSAAKRNPGMLLTDFSASPDRRDGHSRRMRAGHGVCGLPRTVTVEGMIGALPALTLRSAGRWKRYPHRGGSLAAPAPDRPRHSARRPSSVITRCNGGLLHRRAILMSLDHYLP